MLAGVILSDQTRPMMGNLIVWSGTHRVLAAYLRMHGPDVLLESRGYPRIEHGEPVPVPGNVGDLVHAHYLLSHNSGGNTIQRRAPNGVLPAQDRRSRSGLARIRLRRAPR